MPLSKKLIVTPEFSKNCTFSAKSQIIYMKKYDYEKCFQRGANWSHYYSKNSSPFYRWKNILTPFVVVAFELKIQFERASNEYCARELNFMGYRFNNQTCWTDKTIGRKTNYTPTHVFDHFTNIFKWKLSLFRNQNCQYSIIM